MTLSHIYIPMAVLTLKDLSLREKILLSLAMSFNSQGLRMSNDALGEILDISSWRVSRIIKGLEQKEYVRVAAAQSKWRKIYLQQNAKVEGILLTPKEQSKDVLLTPFPTTTHTKRANITKGTKESVHTETKSPVCETDESFQRFFEGYPRKENKAGALREWKKLKPDTGLAQRIIEDVKRRSQTPDWLKDGGKYVPLPKNYLHDQRWEDEAPENQLPTHDATEEELAAVLQGGGI